MHYLSRRGRLTVTPISLALLATYLMFRTCRSFIVIVIAAVVAIWCAVMTAELICDRPWRKWRGRGLA
jgi:hypothetical protein